MELQDKKPKKKFTKIEEMTKEQIRQAILKKRECNAKAQKIVESLLEKSITESYFLLCLPDINQSHFEDIIEERSIIQLCGYPICQNSLLEKDIPKQKYRISMKTNKVYDITARKSFCSNACYKAAMHVKKQMLTSPLWFREYEDIPTFHLLPFDSVGSLGQEIDVALVEKININNEKKQSFTSINDFTRASIQEMSQNNDCSKENDIDEESNSYRTSNECIPKYYENASFNDQINHEVVENKYNANEVIEEGKVSNISSQESQTITRNLEDSKIETHDKVIIIKTQKKPISNPMNIVGDVIEKPEKEVLIIPETSDSSSFEKSDEQRSRHVKKLIQKKQPSVTVITIEVEKCLAEWFTLDTMILLFGEEKVKEMVSDKGECIKEYLNNYANSIFYNSNAYDQYQALCRKLNLLELEDRRFDVQTLQRETKPLPDYSILQEESKRMQLKVKAFFTGETEIPEMVESVKDKPTMDEDVNFTQIPLVDKNAQNALRRRIVMQHLDKVLPDLLRSLGLLTLSISSDVRLLVNTFKLKANNIMFKPIQWTLIAIVIIKLLSLRDHRLEYLLEQPTAYQHMQLLLLSYKQDGGYLDRLISWLTDIDRLLDTNDTQLTIE